jgi:hypothetical protein
LWLAPQYLTFYMFFIILCGGPFKTFTMNFWKSKNLLLWCDVVWIGQKRTLQMSIRCPRPLMTYVYKWLAGSYRNGGLTEDACRQLEIMSRYISESLFRSRHTCTVNPCFLLHLTRRRANPPEIQLITL